MSKNNLLIIQPILTKYRETMLTNLNKLFHGRFTVCADIPSSDFGEVDPKEYNFVKARWQSLFIFRFMPFQIFWKCFKRSDKIVHFADFKYLSLWYFLILCFFCKKKIWLHGQGGYKRSGLIHKMVYILTVGLSDGYICYTEYSKNALKEKIPKFLHKKISVCDNTLDIEPVVELNILNRSESIFYIGRIREGCKIENLLNAAIKSGVKVEVIGSGDSQYLESLKQKFDSIATFYGAVFDEKEQRRIASSCMAGAYGGDAGLSVVHYMALGLPVIVHNDIDKHMGPEPSYVIDGLNGLTFARDNIESLAQKISQLIDDKELRNSLSQGALDTFKKLQKPSMAQKIVNILELGK